MCECVLATSAISGPEFIVRIFHFFNFAGKGGIILGYHFDLVSTCQPFSEQPGCFRVKPGPLLTHESFAHRNLASIANLHGIHLSIRPAIKPHGRLLCGSLTCKQLQ